MRHFWYPREVSSSCANDNRYGHTTIPDGIIDQYFHNKNKLHVVVVVVVVIGNVFGDYRSCECYELLMLFFIDLLIGAAK
jgi:hypothetical protein